MMVISAHVTDIWGIRSVRVKNYHEKGYDIINLERISGTQYDGVWKGTWLVHDTVSKQYSSLVTAYSFSNKFSSTVVSWEDPTWWNLSWMYRKQANIQNPSSNYQMKITIGYDGNSSGVDVHLHAKCRNDFADVRFVNKNNSAALNYWMENKTNGDKAIFWVKTNGEDALNIYYGNSIVNTQSNGSNTFMFFDDFSLNDIDTKKWTVVSSTGWSIIAGELKGTSTTGRLASKIVFSNGVQLQVKTRLVSRANNGHMIGGFWLTTSNGFGYLWHPSNDYIRNDGSWPQISTTVAPGTYILQIDVKSTTHLDYRMVRYSDGAIVKSGTNIANVISNESIVIGQRYDNSYTGQAYEAYWDYIIVKKYTSTEPSWSSFDDEEIALPSKPILIGPLDNTISIDTTPTFQWTLSQNAKNHTIQVSNQSSFLTMIINISLDSTTETYSPLVNIADGKWYWRIKANNSQGINISTTWSFILDTTPPDQPFLLYPLENETKNNNQVTFSWNETRDNTSNSMYVSEIACYQLQVSNNNFVSFIINQNTTDNMTFESTVTVAGRLQWRMRSWDFAGNPSIFSEVRNLTVFDFTLTATASVVTILRGGSGSTTIQIEKEFGEDETITLSNEWDGIPPTGVSVNLSNTTGSDDFTSVISFDSSSISSTGEFNLNLIATSPTGNRTCTITLRIAGMIFQMSATPTAFTLTRSDTDESRISITFQYGTKEEVSLRGEWIGVSPTGVSMSFSQETELPPYDSILSISTSQTASSGKFTYKVIASGGGITNWIYLSIDIQTTLDLTLQTDKTTYEKGQEIQLYGTVIRPDGTKVVEGTVTLTFSINSWEEQINTTLRNGIFSTNYFITFDKFNGTWDISGSAVDTLGDMTISPTHLTITVTVPLIYQYYSIAILSPLPGQTYKRGDVVSFTVSVFENESKIREATVTIQTLDGEKVVLPEISPGLYSKSYTLGMDSLLGNWSVYIMGSTGEDEQFKAGFNYIPIKVEPTELILEILEPTGVSFETGEAITFSVKLKYSDGSFVEQGIVSATKNDGGVLNYKKTSDGVYTVQYTPTDKEIGYMRIQISASDAYGNIGVVRETYLNVVPVQFSSYFVRYWWITCIVLIGLFLALGYVSWDVLRTFRFRYITREVLELQRLKKDKAAEYFITGSISRETYDNLIQDYESKLAKLEKNRHILEKKIRKNKE